MFSIFNMNYAVIFAGGTGSRMKSTTPKQFMLINDKPILVHTLSVFQSSQDIDSILVVCLKDYINTVKDYIKKYNLNKIIGVIPGGKTAFESQKIGISYLKNISSDGDIVFIHDGVRPLINCKLIKDCLGSVKQFGTAITISPAAETIAILNEKTEIVDTMPRQNCMLARAPQAFYLSDIYNAHLRAAKDNKEYIDSASMMLDQGHKLNVVEGPTENIKITTQYEYALCKLLIGGHKNE